MKKHRWISEQQLYQDSNPWESALKVLHDLSQLEAFIPMTSTQSSVETRASNADTQGLRGIRGPEEGFWGCLVGNPSILGTSLQLERRGQIRRLPISILVI